MIDLRESQTFFGICAAIEVMLFALGIYIGYYTLLIFAALGVIAMFVSYLGWDIIEAVIFKRTGVIEVLSGYTVSGDMDSAVFRKDNHYSALAVARVENLGGGKFDQSRFDKIIIGLGFPFRISIQLEKMDTRHITEKLQTKKRMKEIKISNIGTVTNREEMEKRRLTQEVAHLQNQISEIEKGGAALIFSYNLLCTGKGKTSSLAEAEAVSRLRRLCSEFDSAFGSSSRHLRRKELVSFIEMEMLV
jgi:hypothetical protein